WYRPAI
ncbi:periplasmic binding s and sugar binding domain of LacI family protein, partial [Vibrio parahaemolyticus B-265]